MEGYLNFHYCKDSIYQSTYVTFDNYVAKNSERQLTIFSSKIIFIDVSQLNNFLARRIIFGDYLKEEFRPDE